MPSSCVVERLRIHSSSPHRQISPARRASEVPLCAGQMTMSHASWVAAEGAALPVGAELEELVLTPVERIDPVGDGEQRLVHIRPS
jgi:hypothetical protein